MSETAMIRFAFIATAAFVFVIPFMFICLLNEIRISRLERKKPPPVLQIGNMLRKKEVLGQIKTILEPGFKSVKDKLKQWHIECPECESADDIWTHSSSDPLTETRYSCGNCGADSMNLSDIHKSILSTGKLLGLNEEKEG